MLDIVKEWFVIWDPGKLTKDSIAHFVQFISFSCWWLSLWWRFSEHPANKVFDGTKHICHLLALIEVWTGEACIVWNTKHNKKSVVVPLSELPGYVKQHINTRDRLYKVSLFKCPVFVWQLITLSFNHQFVVLHSASGLFISIEKNSVGFVVQISEKRDNVVDCIIGEKRATNIFNDIEEVTDHEADGTIEEALEWMSQRIKVEKYKIKYNNCKHFAQRSFLKFQSRYQPTPLNPL